MVHRLHDSGDFLQPFLFQMLMVAHHLQNLDEFLKTIRFGCPETILKKERNDNLAQIIPASHAIPVDILPVIVMATIHEDISTGEEILQTFENVESLRSLRNHKLWKYLPSQSHSSVTLD